jgi:hypothetical protein
MTEASVSLAGELDDPEVPARDVDPARVPALPPQLRGAPHDPLRYVLNAKSDPASGDQVAPPSVLVSAIPLA